MYLGACLLVCCLSVHVCHWSSCPPPRTVLVRACGHPLSHRRVLVHVRVRACRYRHICRTTCTYCIHFSHSLHSWLVICVPPWSPLTDVDMTDSRCVKRGTTCVFELNKSIVRRGNFMSQLGKRKGPPPSSLRGPGQQQHSKSHHILVSMGPSMPTITE